MLSSNALVTSVGMPPFLMMSCVAVAFLARRGDVQVIGARFGIALRPDVVRAMAVHAVGGDRRRLCAALAWTLCLLALHRSEWHVAQSTFASFSDAGTRRPGQILVAVHAGQPAVNRLLEHAVSPRPGGRRLAPRPLRAGETVRVGRGDGGGGRRLVLACGTGAAGGGLGPLALKGQCERPEHNTGAEYSTRTHGRALSGPVLECRWSTRRRPSVTSSSASQVSRQRVDVLSRQRLRELIAGLRSASSLRSSPPDRVSHAFDVGPPSVFEPTSSRNPSIAAPAIE